jgi:single-stranded DNA-binding protein
MNNSVLFIGRVEQAPIELTASDKKLVRFAVAVKQFCFFEPRLFEIQSTSGVAERVLATVTKGHEVAVQGSLAVSQPFTNEAGVLIRKPFIELTRFCLCDGKP